MLLSMFISFLLAKMFRGKIYVLLVIVSLALISFFSVGLPSYNFISEDSVVAAKWLTV